MNLFVLKHYRLSTETTGRQEKKSSFSQKHYEKIRKNRRDSANFIDRPEKLRLNSRQMTLGGNSREFRGADL